MEHHPKKLTYFHRQGFNAACDRLKQIVCVVPRSEIGNQILEAVEILPNDSIKSLPNEVRKTIEAFLILEEIHFHAQAVIEEITRQFPMIGPPK